MNINLKTLNTHLPVNGLDGYIAYANQISFLSKEEEETFARRLQKNNDLEAAKHLILPHLRYVIRVAKNYLGYGLPLADLIQEGNIGLMKAVKRFNPDVGARLATFAIHWIKAEIHEFILRNWRIVKVATTKAQRKLFFNLRQMKKQLSWMSQEEVNVIAKDLKVKPEEVREMEMRLASTDTSYNTHNDSSDHEDSAYTAPEAFLGDHQYNPSEQLEQEDLATQGANVYQALACLDSRSQDIVRARWLEEENKATLQTLANKYRISAERVRQLEKDALIKLRSTLELSYS